MKKILKVLKPYDLHQSKGNIVSIKPLHYTYDVG